MRETKVDKPRLFQDGRDMLISLGVMLLLMFLVIGTTGLCHYNPGKPSTGKVTRVDDTTFLSMEAQSASYPVRIPNDPPDWVPNTARRVSIDNEVGSSVGWVHDKDWIELIQTGAPEDSIPKGIDGKARSQTGTRDVEGQTWNVYTSTDNDVRPVWVNDRKDVRWVITGLGSDKEFSTIASAIQNAPVEKADQRSSAPQTSEATETSTAGAA